MAEQGVDVLLLSLGHDLPYLTGYHAMPLERLTMLVVPRDADGHAAGAPARGAARRRAAGCVHAAHLGRDRGSDRPRRRARRARPATVAVGDQMWARFLVELLPHLPGASFRRAVDVVGPLRMVKDAAEIDALRAASAAADRVARQLQGGEIALVGRTEAEVSADISARLLAEGHDKVNFAIVAAGPNAASPHHDAGDRVIAAGEIVLCDFGGTMDGYCSDITRCVFTGGRAAGRDRRGLRRAARSPAGRRGRGNGRQLRARRSTGSGGGSSPTPATATYFIHRIGHGIGMEAHEDPYMVEGNSSPLAAGNAFSVEPGIYLPGRWGMRLEDIVVATADGPEALNTVRPRSWSSSEP